MSSLYTLEPLLTHSFQPENSNQKRNTRKCRRCILWNHSRLIPLGQRTTINRETIKGDFVRIFSFLYVIQHGFICRPSDSSLSAEAGIEPRTLALTARRYNHTTRSHPHTAGSHLLSARSHPHSASYHPHSARFHPHLARSHPHSVRSHPRKWCIFVARIKIKINPTYIMLLYFGTNPNSSR